MDLLSLLIRYHNVYHHQVDHHGIDMIMVLPHLLKEVSHCMCVMDSVHCCIVSCCPEVLQTDIKSGIRSSMLNLHDIVLCVLIIVAVVSLLIFPSVYNPTTGELVLNNDIIIITLLLYRKRKG